MSTEPDQVVPVIDVPEQEQNTEPEQQAEVAHPDGEGTQDESKPELDPLKKLELAEQSIKKLQRRTEKLAGKHGDAARERDALRAEIAKLSAGKDDEEPAPADIDELVTKRAQEINRIDALNKRAEVVLKSGGKLKGFETAVETLRDEVPFLDSKGRITPFLEAVLESDTPAAVIHYLGNNPDEAAEFDGLSPAQIGRRLAKLEDKLERDGKAKVSKAPAPINPLGHGRANSVDLASADMDAYVAQRRKQGAPWAR